MHLLTIQIDNSDALVMVAYPFLNTLWCTLRSMQVNVCGGKCSAMAVERSQVAHWYKLHVGVYLHEVFLAPVLRSTVPAQSRKNSGLVPSLDLPAQNFYLLENLTIECRLAPWLPDNLLLTTL